MPLKKAKGKSKSAIDKAIAYNIHELVHNGKKERPHSQIVAIAERVARSGSKKKKK